MKKAERKREAILRHTLNLQRIFDLEVGQIVGLYDALRKIEKRGERLGLRLCNGPEIGEAGQERQEQRILDDLDRLLGFRAKGVPVFVNLDPRGYALKIDDAWVREYQTRTGDRLHTDWGGYGILAPDFTNA